MRQPESARFLEDGFVILLLSSVSLHHRFLSIAFA